MKKLLYLCIIILSAAPVATLAQGFVVVIASDYNRAALQPKFDQAAADGLNPGILDMKLRKGIVYRVCSGFFSDINAAADLWDRLRQKEEYKDVWILPVPENYLLNMPEINREEFTAIYNDIVQKINRKDYAGLNRYINPDNGFYVMINPGSSFLPVYLDSIPTRLDELFSTGIFIYFDESIPFQPGNIKFGELPEYNCESGDWSAEGCFVQGVKTYSRISRWEYSLLEYDDWVDESVQKLRRAESKIILRTVNTGGFEIDFAFENGKWYIAAFDLATECNQ